MTDTNTAAALSAGAELKPFKDQGTSPRDDLRQAAMKWRPGGRAEWSFQQYDGTNIGQWWSRANVSWSPSGPLLVIPRLATPAPAALEGTSLGEGYPRLTGYPDYINDAEGLSRIRSSLLKVKDWHDLTGSIVNCNSLARLLDTIEMQRAQIAALQPSSAADAKPVDFTVENIAELIRKHALTRSGEKVTPRESVTAAEMIYRLYAQPQPSQQAGAEGLEAAMRTACDLLSERTYGNAARSPGHNARLVLESALAALKPVSA